MPDSVSAIRFLGNEIAEQRPEVQEWVPPRGAAVDRDSLTAATTGYSALRNFKLDNAYPVVEGYQDIDGNLGVAGGMRFNFSDRIGATGLDVTASYSPGQELDASERLHLTSQTLSGQIAALEKQKNDVMAAEMERTKPEGWPPVTWRSMAEFMARAFTCSSARACRRSCSRHRSYPTRSRSDGSVASALTAVPYIVRREKKRPSRSDGTRSRIQLFQLHAPIALSP